MIDKKEYTGSVYIGVVGTESVHVNAYSSIYKIHTWAGDGAPIYLSATKGFEARQQHINKFLASKYDFILLLDGDQTFPADTLDRLRSHKLPYVSGFYLFRSNIPRPIWFKWQKKNGFPMKPYYEIPEPGKLVKLGASGWGCMLIHREVFEGIGKILKGEPLVIEDDMDVWPYDLGRILTAIQILEEAGESEAVRKSVIEALREEIRPLRVAKDNIGSDLRFPFFAREAGFTLWGDPDIRCGHMINYTITPTDLESTAKSNPEGFEANRKEYAETIVKRERKRLRNIQKIIENLDVTEIIETIKAEEAKAASDV